MNVAFCNQRRFYRIDTEMAVFIDVTASKERVHIERGDFGALPVPVFDKTKTAWLDGKLWIFIDKKRVAARVDPQSERYFDLLMEKVLFFKEQLHYLAEGENPYFGPLADRIRDSVAQLSQPVSFDEKFAEASPNTTRIMRQLDRRVSAAIERAGHVFSYSTQGSMHVFHLLEDDGTGKMVERLKPFASYAPLAAAFVAFHDYLQALEAIYAWLMRRNDEERRVWKMPVNLSCGGIRLNLPFRVRPIDKVRVEMFIEPVPGVPFTYSTDAVEVEGHCVRTHFNPEQGDFETVINFDFIPDAVYRRIDSYMINLEMKQLSDYLKGMRA